MIRYIMGDIQAIINDAKDSNLNFIGPIGDLNIKPDDRNFNLDILTEIPNKYFLSQSTFHFLQSALNILLTNLINILMRRNQ